MLLVDAGVAVRLRDLAKTQLPAGLLMLQQMTAVAEREAGMTSIQAWYALVAA